MMGRAGLLNIIIGEGRVLWAGVDRGLITCIFFVNELFYLHIEKLK